MTAWGGQQRSKSRWRHWSAPCIYPPWAIESHQHVRLAYYSYLRALLLTWINLIPAWISHHMPSKVWDEITSPFLNSNDWTAEELLLINSVPVCTMAVLYLSGVKVILILWISCWSMNCTSVHIDMAAGYIHILFPLGSLLLKWINFYPSMDK